MPGWPGANASDSFQEATFQQPITFILLIAGNVRG